ncbi:hypothetical protein GCM10022396_26110 [Flavivirga amylovorans]
MMNSLGVDPSGDADMDGVLHTVVLLLTILNAIKALKYLILILSYMIFITIKLKKLKFIKQFYIMSDYNMKMNYNVLRYVTLLW